MLAESSRGPAPKRKLRIGAIGLRGVPSRYSGLETSAQCLYRELARHGHEITARIVFTGLLKGSQLTAVFSQAAAFVSPSEMEGLPMALLECMELGVPAVVSGIPPHRELLEPVDGYDLFFALGEVERLSSLLTRVLSAPDGCRELVRSCQQHVRRFYGWPRIAELTEMVYARARSRRS